MAQAEKNGRSTVATGRRPAFASASGKEGLANFQKLVTTQNYCGLGFASPDDAQKSPSRRSDRSLPYWPRRARGLQAGHEIDDIMVDAKRNLYPVNVDGHVASSIYVTQSDYGWRATDFGNAAVARAVTSYRYDKRDIVVQIAALKVYYVGRWTDGAMTLTTFTDDRSLGFKAGQTMPADRAQAILQRAAASCRCTSRCGCRAHRGARKGRAATASLTIWSTATINEAGR